MGCKWHMTVGSGVNLSFITTQLEEKEPPKVMEKTHTHHVTCKTGTHLAVAGVVPPK